MDTILTQIGQFVITIISSLGYAGVFIAMAIESAAIPLPSEIILPFTGYMVFIGKFNIWGALILINEKELAWTERLFARHGEITVFVGRLLPVVRTFISLPAGIAYWLWKHQGGFKCKS